ALPTNQGSRIDLPRQQSQQKPAPESEGRVSFLPVLAPSTFHPAASSHTALPRPATYRKVLHRPRQSLLQQAWKRTMLRLRIHGSIQSSSELRLMGLAITQSKSASVL